MSVIEDDFVLTEVMAVKGGSVASDLTEVASKGNAPTQVPVGINTAMKQFSAMMMSKMEHDHLQSKFKTELEIANAMDTPLRKVLQKRITEDHLESMEKHRRALQARLEAANNEDVGQLDGAGLEMCCMMFVRQFNEAVSTMPLDHSGNMMMMMMMMMLVAVTTLSVITLGEEEESRSKKDKETAKLAETVALVALRLKRHRDAVEHDGRRRKRKVVDARHSESE
jgi:hypothetical protein